MLDRWHADAIWWSFPLASLCSIVMATGYYRFGGWRKVRLGILAEQPAPAPSV
jgi:Na+-driven multidrug efflux pump